MKKTVLKLGAVMLAATMALAGCSDPDSGKTKVTFLSWTGEEQMKPILDAFHAANEDIKIEASYSPPVAEYIQTLQTRVLSGTAPDVFVIAAENKTNLLDGGHVIDLSGEPYMSKIESFNTETYGRDGKAYGVSVSSWAAGYMYNEDLLKQVGYDTFPTTWDDFLVMSKKLQDAGIKPFLESVDQMPTTVSAWIGAKTNTMDGTLDDKIFSGETTFEAEWTPYLEQYNRIYTEGLVSKDVVGLDGDMIRDEFANGRVAVMNAGPWVINALRESSPDLKFKFALVPGVDGGEPFAAGAASPGYAINSKSDETKQAAAKKFLEFLASKEGVQIFHEQTRDVTVTDDFEPEVDPAFEPLASSIRNGQLYLPMIAWQRSEDILNVEAVAQIQRMIQGEITPAEVAKAMDTKLAGS